MNLYRLVTFTLLFIRSAFHSVPEFLHFSDFKVNKIKVKRARLYASKNYFREHNYKIFQMINIVYKKIFLSKILKILAYSIFFP